MNLSTPYINTASHPKIWVCKPCFLMPLYTETAHKCTMHFNTLQCLKIKRLPGLRAVLMSFLVYYWWFRFPFIKQHWRESHWYWCISEKRFASSQNICTYECCLIFSELLFHPYRHALLREHTKAEPWKSTMVSNGNTKLYSNAFEFSCVRSEIFCDGNNITN